MRDNPTAIYTEGLVKRYRKTAALAGLDLAVPPGLEQGVLGPNQGHGASIAGWT